MTVHILEVLKKRRSIRKFKEEEIHKETLDQILEAGLLAPSSKNKKPVEFIVVEDKKTIEALKLCKSKGAEGLSTAPCAIVVIGDRGLSDVWVEDASIATISMQLAAEELGLGSVWIQMRKRMNENGDGEEAVRKVLDIPDAYGVLSMIALGYKDEEKQAHDMASLDYTKVHRF